MSQQPIDWWTGISIHALREEGDYRIYACTVGSRSFLSTPSVRRATWLRPGRPHSTTHFYPRPP